MSSGSSDSKPESLKRVEKLTNKKVEFEEGDLNNCDSLRSTFKKVLEIPIIVTI